MSTLSRQFASVFFAASVLSWHPPGWVGTVGASHGSRHPVLSSSGLSPVAGATIPTSEGLVLATVGVGWFVCVESDPRWWRYP